ncbi:MAG: hypothetical protein WC401_11425 [Bacteroidales bacterium]|jgi:hypothetical protein
MRKSIKVLIEKAEAVNKSWFAILDADKWRKGMDQAIKELSDAIKKVKGES